MPVGPLVRDGQLVRLRQHVPANKPAFQRWYADPEIAYLLRHDLEPLSAGQSASYFDSLILPLSQRGLCYAIHDVSTDRLIGTTALTDLSRRTTGRRSALFRIVIGEKDVWDRGFGTEATRLVVAEAFETHDLTEVRLEVFRHNPRAIKAYERVGFTISGEHVEWVGRSRRELNVIEMRLRRPDETEAADNEADAITPAPEASPLEDMGESAAARAARIARRRELRQQRRSQRETNDVTDAESAIQEPRLSPP
jgi:RimJ/RimL family protein N-acetyltransferase